MRIAVELQNNSAIQGKAHIHDQPKEKYVFLEQLAMPVQDEEKIRTELTIRGRSNLISYTTIKLLIIPK